MCKLSVFIPTFNGEKYIKQAIKSVLDQTYEDFKLIIVDDLSTDETFNIAESFCDPRLEIHKNDEHLGLVGNWNRCLEIAEEEFIHIFHQDDVMMKNALHILLSGFTNNDIGFVFSNIKSIDENGTIIGGHWNIDALPKQNKVFNVHELFHLLLQKGNIIPCQTVMLRTNYVKKLGRFNPRLKYTPDLEMWLRLSLNYSVAYINEPLVFLRRHKHQETNLYLGSSLDILEVWNTYKIIFSEQMNKIQCFEYIYYQAMEHLINWTAEQFIVSIKNKSVTNSINHLKLWIIFNWFRLIGFQIVKNSTLS